MNIVIGLIDSCVGEKIEEKNLKGRVSNFHTLLFIYLYLNKVQWPIVYEIEGKYLQTTYKIF